MTMNYQPFSGTVRGPPLSPWQASVSFAKAHSLIFELKKMRLKMRLDKVKVSI